MIELEPETNNPNDRDYDSEDEIDHGLLHHRALQPISTTIDEIKDKPVVIPWKASREWDLGPTTNPNQLPLPRSRPGTPRVDSGLFERPQGSTSTAVPLNDREDGKESLGVNQKDEEEEDEDGEVLCRICFMGAEEEVDLGRLISPCLCRGSMRVSRGGASLTYTTRAIGIEVDVIVLPSPSFLSHLPATIWNVIRTTMPGPHRHVPLIANTPCTTNLSHDPRHLQSPARA